MSLDNLDQADLPLFLKIIKSVNSQVDKDILLEEIVEASKTLLKSEGSAILLLDKEKGELSFKYADKQISNNIIEIRVPMGQGVAGEVAVSGQSMIVNDPNDPRIYKGVDKVTSRRTNNLLCVPMRLKGEIIGVLEVINHREKKGYDDADKALLSLFSECAAIVINNRELFEASSLKVKQLSAIYQISRFVTYSATSTDGLCREIISIIKREISTERISIILLDNSTKKFKFVYGKNIPRTVLQRGNVTVKENVLSYIKKNKKGILCFNIESDNRFGIQKKLRYQNKSFISVPLIYKKVVIGFISITECKTTTPFDHADLDFMVTIADEFIQGYKLIELKKELIEKKNIDTEVEITAKLQKSVLPQTFPDFPGIDFAVEYKSKKKVGGDFYDFLKLDKNQFMGLVADISGKGIPSSVFMSICRSILKMSMEEEISPKRIFYKANKHIYENSGEGMFATAFLFKLDTVSKKITYSDAGHLEQYHYSFKKEKICVLDVKSKPLGILQNIRFEEKTVNYEKKDVIVLFTDGLLEATNKKGEEFGEDRIMETIKENHSLKAESIKRKIIQAVKSFTKKNEYDDDFTLLIIKFG